MFPSATESKQSNTAPQLIKKLSATPVIPPQADHGYGVDALDPQSSLQANKATFFFRVERELEKVNTFYLQKEAELRLRLTTLLDKKRAMQQHPESVSKTSSRYVALEEGLKQFSMDLNKLEQFVEVNATAFSKILKKWDKTSKSREKQLYLSRAVEVQPCFNRDVISSLSDQATQALLDFSGWAEGDKVHAAPADAELRAPEAPMEVNAELDNQIAQAISTANTQQIEECLSRMSQLKDAQDRISRAFLSTVEDAPDGALKIILDTKQVDLCQVDEINERNCLHKAAICGRSHVLRLGLQGNVDVHAADVYGRIPLHYASMHGHVELVDELINAAPDTVNFRDQDSFTPLIHAIVHSQLACVQILLSKGAHISRLGPSEHIPLNLACQYASLDIVELLLQRHAEMLPDAEGLYPQHLVARSGKVPQMLLLLQKYGADLDQPDKLYQWTPIFHAASEGHVECVQTLLECGVDVDIMDEKGLSAMYYATWEGHLECMKLLASVGRGIGLTRQAQVSPRFVTQTASGTMPGPMEVAGDEEGIPDFILPPPIIPFRRYGHNFLDTKTFVVISFERLGKSAIQFYDDKKYPAARLTISSKSSDLIPRNILLPMQDEFKVISFQIENLDTFSIDFDIYPTFGSRVIARGVASSKVFTNRGHSTGQWHLELFDPRLRAIGRITFDFQVVKPFHGIPLEITHFATYWKATSQLDSQPHALVTGSSLSGEYIRLYVQLTADRVPVLYPRWKINYHGLDIPVNILTYAQFAAIGASQDKSNVPEPSALEHAHGDDIPGIYKALASCFLTLKDALGRLPVHIHVELHVLFPSQLEEDQLKLGPAHDMNDFADEILSVVFTHARTLREQGAGEIDGTLRSVIFSSFNQDICTVINWKQPNCKSSLSPRVYFS
jgi:CDK inhibitor PHO81